MEANSLIPKPAEMHRWRIGASTLDIIQKHSSRCEPGRPGRRAPKLTVTQERRSLRQKGVLPNGTLFLVFVL